MPACWTPPPQIYYELQQRLAQRASLLEWRTQVNNQFHALSVSPVVVPSVRERLVELIDTVNQHIAQMDAELLELVKIEPEPPPDGEIQRAISEAEQIEQQWKAASALLLTIPGIGLLTACWLVVATLNFSTCETAETATHSLGLAPSMRTSGTSVRGRAQIGHSGHARARTHLYLATLAAARFNPVIKRYYDRLRKAGKPSDPWLAVRVLGNSCISRLRSSNLNSPSIQITRRQPRCKRRAPKLPNDVRNGLSRADENRLFFDFNQACLFCTTQAQPAHAESDSGLTRPAAWYPAYSLIGMELVRFR